MIIESSIEDYVDNLTSLVNNTDSKYALAGFMGASYLYEEKLMKYEHIVHIPFFDNRELNSGLTNNHKPLTSFNVILFNGPIVVGQIYLTNVSDKR